MKQLEMLYEGKAKQVFRTDDPDKIIIHYKDAATAFNNIKKACLLYTSPSPRDRSVSRMPSSA